MRDRHDLIALQDLGGRLGRAEAGLALGGIPGLRLIGSMQGPPDRAGRALNSQIDRHGLFKVFGLWTESVRPLLDKVNPRIGRLMP